MVAPSAHQSGRTKSAISPKTVKMIQKIFRSTVLVYRIGADGYYGFEILPMRK